MIYLRKNENGITIITLIITVVLLVLITGTLAINSYNSLELSNLKNLENDISILSDRIAAYYVKTGELPTNGIIYLKSELENIFDVISENDGDNYYVIDLSKLDNTTLSYSNNTYIVNEESHNIYNLEGILYNGKQYFTVGKDEEIVSVNNNDYFTAYELNSMIGKYVNYTPEEGIYSLTTENNTYSGTVDNIEDFTTENLNWRIWKIEGNTLTLIADDITRDGGTGDGTLKLYGFVGYNNGVKIQNDICKNCYSNAQLGAVGRSANIEDIESVLNTNEWTPEQFSILAYGTQDTYYTYGEPKRYTASNRRYYPYIWQFEEYAKIVNNNNVIENEEGTGITRSTQNEYYAGNEYTSVQADASIDVTMTVWSRAFYGERFTDIKKSIYFDLLFYNSDNQALTYNLASRYAAISATSYYAFFGFYRVEDGSIVYNYLCSSGNTSFGQGRKFAIRPMVEINLTNVTLDTTNDGDTYQTAYELTKKQ